MPIEITEKEIRVIARQRQWGRVVIHMIAVFIVSIATVFIVDAIMGNGAISLTIVLIISLALYLYAWRKIVRIENTAANELLEQFHNEGVKAVYAEPVNDGVTIEPN